MRRRRPCCATQAYRSARMMWRSCTGRPRDGRPGCTWPPSALGRAARSQPKRTPSGGDDRLVSEYIQSEFLARISSRQRVFLTRTAVLERLCGPLCEAVLDAARGRRRPWRTWRGRTLLLVPLDARGEWYRYHHLFRDMLLAELRRQEPELIPVLRRRAAGWCARNDLPEEAVEYTIAAGDVDMAAALAAGGTRACGLTGRAKSPPSSGGSGGCRTGAGRRDTRWWPCWPGSCPR